MSLIRMACGNCWCGLVPVETEDGVRYKFCPVCKGDGVVLRRFDDEGMANKVFLAPVSTRTRPVRVRGDRDNQGGGR